MARDPDDSGSRHPFDAVLEMHSRDEPSVIDKASINLGEALPEEEIDELKCQLHQYIIKRQSACLLLATKELGIKVRDPNITVLLRLYIQEGGSFDEAQPRMPHGFVKMARTATGLSAPTIRKKVRIVLPTLKELALDFFNKRTVRPPFDVTLLTTYTRLALRFEQYTLTPDEAEIMKHLLKDYPSEELPEVVFASLLRLGDKPSAFPVQKLLHISLTQACKKRELHRWLKAFNYIYDEQKPISVSASRGTDWAALILPEPLQDEHRNGLLYLHSKLWPGPGILPAFSAIAKVCGEPFTIMYGRSSNIPFTHGQALPDSPP